MTYLRKVKFISGVAVLSSVLPLSGCSKKEAEPTPVTSQSINVPQFLATLQSLPMSQRKAYLKQHPAEEQVIMQSDDPQQAQALVNSIGTR